MYIVFRYYWLKSFVVGTVMLLAATGSFSQDVVKTNFVVILECSFNDEIQATISNLVSAGEPTDQFKLKTRLSPDVLYFNARAGLNIHERFTRICSDALEGKVTSMKE